MDVVFLVGMGVMLAVVGHPADRAPLGGGAADGRHDIFEPLRPDLETPVGEQAVIGQRDP